MPFAHATLWQGGKRPGSSKCNSCTKPGLLFSASLPVSSLLRLPTIQLPEFWPTEARTQTWTRAATDIVLWKLWGADEVCQLPEPSYSPAVPTHPLRASFCAFFLSAVSTFPILLSVWELHTEEKGAACQPCFAVSHTTGRVWDGSRPKPSEGHVTGRKQQEKLRPGGMCDSPPGG